MSEVADPIGELDGGKRLVTSDPARLRALAHPVRVELMRLLDDLGEATATELAERIGESPSNCSFHLRQLAKAGFIERCEARGTAKPWRPAHKGRDLRPDSTDLASVRASGAIGAIYVEQEAARLVEHLTTTAETDPAWVQASTINTSTFWATPEEAQEVIDAIHHLADRFAGRGGPDGVRPEGARIVRLFAAVNADSV